MALATTVQLQGALLQPDLRHELEAVYGSRLDRVLRSFRGMGESYYFRLNTLRGTRESILNTLIQEGLRNISIHRTIRNAAFLPVRQRFLEAKGRPVVADKFASEAVLQGAHLYAPGVRNCQGLRLGMESSVVDEGGTVVGNGLARQGENAILTHRQGMAVEITENQFGIPSIMERESYDRGLIHLQTLPAMVTCHVLDPRPDETIVDLNCAPGGKLSYICQLSANRAKVIGFDRNNRKLDRTKKHLHRLGCENYQLIVHDSRYVHEDFQVTADKVLVDPSCTGLGVLPKLFVDVTMSDVRNLSDYQKQFLRTASRIVKSGGVVVYSVCTITRQECEGVVDYATDVLGLVLDEATPLVGETGLDGFGRTQRFHPDIDGAGFFIARFLKP